MNTSVFLPELYGQPVVIMTVVAVERKKNQMLFKLVSCFTTEHCRWFLTLNFPKAKEQVEMLASRLFEDLHKLVIPKIKQKYVIFLKFDIYFV